MAKEKDKKEPKEVKEPELTQPEQPTPSEQPAPSTPQTGNPVFRILRLKAMAYDLSMEIRALQNTISDRQQRINLIEQEVNALTMQVRGAGQPIPNPPPIEGEDVKG